jgi:hypothetical protein
MEIKIHGDESIEPFHGCFSALPTITKAAMLALRTENKERKESDTVLSVDNSFFINSEALIECCVELYVCYKLISFLSPSKKSCTLGWDGKEVTNITIRFEPTLSLASQLN